MHNTAPTSREHYRTFDPTEQHQAILRLMRQDATRVWCIADVAKVLGMEKSTISGRMKELKKAEVIEFDSKRPSRTTGIMSEHFKVRLQDKLF